MTITLAVLGDSIAYGQGADDPADTIGERLALRLGAAGYPTRLGVFAVPGARSDALAAQVGPALVAGADIALVVVGANDLARFVPTHVAAGQLADAVSRLVEAGVRVVVVPAPDMSFVPWVPTALRATVRAASTALQQAQSRNALIAGARVVDVSSPALAAFGHDGSLFSADRFHPSSAGYALIADAITPAVLAAAEDAAA